MKIIREALRNERERRGLGVLAFEKELGFPEGGLRAIMRDKNPQSPSIEKAQQIADALGLSFYIGPVRAGDPNASSTIFGALESPEVQGFETRVDEDGYVGLKIDGREWTGILLLPPSLSKDLGVSLTHRAMQIEESD